MGVMRMREILFRGLHRRKGEKVKLDGTPIESMWVYGGYCQYNEERGIIYQTEPNICKYPVYADSVGQYTGVNDKNGNKIFEGDILKSLTGKYILVTNSGCGNWTFIDIQDDRICDWLNVRMLSSCQIVDNIHDNPDFVETYRLKF